MTRGRRGWRRALPALALLLALAPLVAAHGEGHDEALERQLVEAGNALMIGSFDASQAGPLIVVPYHDGPLPCGRGDAVGYRIQIGEDAGVTFLANATHVEAGFDAPGDGYLAFAVDTHDASRALIVMQEHAVARHALAAGVLRESRIVDEGVGVLGIPYLLPDTPVAAGHDAFAFHAQEGRGIRIAYEEQGIGEACESIDGSYVGFRFARADLPDALSPGRVVHVVALHDPEVAQLLPRPIDGSTRILEANLYLARPGEDPAEVRAAFAPAPEAATTLPLAGIALAGAWVVLGRRPRGGDP